MNALKANIYRVALPPILRGDSNYLLSWIRQSRHRQFVFALVVIVVGSSCYGAAVGWWRDPVQACYVALKFPFILLGTAFANALVNGMLAPLFGLQIGFRQSLLAILTSFMIAAAILGSSSPLIFFLVWNAPPLQQAQSAGTVHAAILLLDVVVIAFAGIAANARLIRLLRELSGNATVAYRIFFGWLLLNLFLGSQLSWILRPFIGSPDLPVEFLRPDALKGNFYESVFHAVQHLAR